MIHEAIAAWQMMAIFWQVRPDTMVRGGCTSHYFTEYGLCRCITNCKNVRLISAELAAEMMKQVKQYAPKPTYDYDSYSWPIGHRQPRLNFCLEMVKILTPEKEREMNDEKPCRIVISIIRDTNKGRALAMMANGITIAHATLEEANNTVEQYLDAASAVLDGTGKGLVFGIVNIVNINTASTEYSKLIVS